MDTTNGTNDTDESFLQLMDKIWSADILTCSHHKNEQIVTIVFSNFKEYMKFIKIVFANQIANETNFVDLVDSNEHTTMQTKILFQFLYANCDDMCKKFDNFTQIDATIVSPIDAPIVASIDSCTNEYMVTEQFNWLYEILCGQLIGMIIQYVIDDIANVLNMKLLTLVCILYVLMNGLMKFVRWYFI